MIEHQRLVQHYRESKSGLQAQLEAGITFKKSTAKGSSDLDFVPVNLHIQQMKVTSEEPDFKGENMTSFSNGVVLLDTEKFYTPVTKDDFIAL